MKAKYDRIGIHYDQTRKADPYITSRLRFHLQPNLEGLYLDIGCGTGNYTHELQKDGFRFIGIDPSLEMLEKARMRNSQIDWRKGSAENTGLTSNYVDGVVASLTLHHWSNLYKGFAELQRVLKSNGTLVIFTATPKQMKGYWLNRYFPEMLQDAMRQMPSMESIEEGLAQSGFEIIGTETYFIQPDLQDKFLYCGKQNPELYFDPSIRNGISSFADLARQKEVEEGLSQLKRDIDSGAIHEVIQSYENNDGDYLLIIGKKSKSNSSK
ncbi:MAG: class I SAM-dependent methyltransferase [Bacteroidota bacterium]